MAGTNYGVYGSWGYYAILIAISVLSITLLIFNFLRPFFTVTFVVSTSLLFLLVVIPQLLYAEKRIEFVPRIASAGEITEGDRVLDIGTGRGFLAIEIAKLVKGCRVVGIDIWGTTVKGEMHQGFVLGNTKKNAEKNAQLESVSDRVEFRQADAREMPFESQSFDVVVSYLVMHQIIYGERGNRVLEETFRVLKPNGRLVIVDLIFGKKIMKKLQELGFREIRVQSIRSLASFSLLKMLSAVK